MEYLKLKENECLFALAELMNLSVSVLAESILKDLEKLGVVSDDSAHAGRLVSALVNQKQMSMPGVIVLTVRRYDKRIDDLFGGLILMAKHGDCESCGMETETFTERIWGTVYKVERCLDRNLCRWENREVYNG